MAGQPPDPRNLNSWEDAFQYPLPVVRKLEQQLRKNIDENRQKLRSLVGASYRDLLGTAERIIEMDEQISTVEKGLSDIGRKCNARAVEKVGENHARMRTSRDMEEHSRYRAMAQTKVLQNALTVTSRTIKAGGDALLAAKLLVLARLLYKSLAEGSNPPAVLDNLRRRLGTSRKKLLSYVERALVRPGMDKATTANTLCAYALVSSSAPKDVFRHFLQVRLENIESKLDRPSETTVSDMLDAYGRTMMDTRAQFPRRFEDALSSLSKLPLLQDHQIQDRHELSLDVFGMWIPDDVRTFIPWVRQEHLLASEVRDEHWEWCLQARERVLQAVKARVASEREAGALLAMRKQILAEYLALKGSFPQHAVKSSIDEIRLVFLQKLEELVKSCAASGESALSDSTEVSLTVTRRPNDLWALASEDFELGSGAIQFREAVISRRHGRDGRLQAARDRLDAFSHDLDHFWELTQHMRASNWDAELDLDLDELPEGEEIHEALTRTDPDRLQSVLRQATTEALRHMYNWVRGKSVGSEDPALLIRLLRELDERRKVLTRDMTLADDDGLDGIIMDGLHRSLADVTSTQPLQQYVGRQKLRSRTPVTLWDGSPPLPVQPSPATFKLLTELHEAMSRAGNDLWSLAAVAAIKTQVDEAVYRASSQMIGGLDAGDEQPVANGHAEDNATASKDTAGAAIKNGDHGLQGQHRERLLQLTFDLLYLQRLTRRSSAEDDTFIQKVIPDLVVRLDLDPLSQERLKKSANEYWKRTYLLFGLLAPNNA